MSDIADKIAALKLEVDQLEKSRAFSIQVKDILDKTNLKCIKLDNFWYAVNLDVHSSDYYHNRSGKWCAYESEKNTGYIDQHKISQIWDDARAVLKEKYGDQIRPLTVTLRDNITVSLEGYFRDPYKTIWFEATRNSIIGPGVIRVGDYGFTFVENIKLSEIKPKEHGRDRALFLDYMRTSRDLHCRYATFEIGRAFGKWSTKNDSLCDDSLKAILTFAQDFHDKDTDFELIRCLREVVDNP